MGSTLVLDGDRFRIDVDWRDFSGNTGQGTVKAGERFDDGGSFEFPGLEGAPGLDLFVQMTDGCSDNNNFWVLTHFATETNVEYTLTVTDTRTNQTREYFNPLGTVAEAITDTNAFATCP